jgi:DNA-directed RNA polymerase specialized sigma24 family protein
MSSGSAVIDMDVLRRARKGNLRAATQVMTACYPEVYRIAYGLSGRDDVGRGVAKLVMRQGLKVLPTWMDDGEPMRWCHHHTVLIARRAARHQPEMTTDTLVRHAQTDNAYYASFIRAVRALPVQQKEAFILTHGEELDIRGLAVAMDCSTEAASNHLKAATTSLSALGGDYFAAFTAQLAHTYKSLTPQDDLVLTNVSWNVRRYLWPQKVWRLCKFVITVLAVAGLGYLIWKYWGKLVY